MIRDELGTKAFKKGISSFEYLRYLILLQLKLFRLPHGHAVRTFELLVSHVKAHYNHCYSTYIASVIRNLVSFVSLLLVQLCSKGSGVGGGRGVECGGIYHIGSHGEQFSLFMVRCLGYFCNWLHFDRDLLFMLLSKMISLSPVIMPYDLLTAMPDFHLFFSGDQTIPREPCPHEKDA